jgi:hypothetical protein
MNRRCPATSPGADRACAPSYLKYSMVFRMGLRPYKELMPMLKPQVDLENGVVHIPDSKTPHGIGDMPMTALARTAFAAQIAETPGSEYLFPTPNPKAQKQYITNLRKVWVTTLRRRVCRLFRCTSSGAHSLRGLAPAG